MVRSTAVFGVVLALGAAALTSSAVADASSTTPARETTMRIHVVDTDERVAFHDVNKNGRLDFGDYAVFRSVDKDPHGKVVGHGIGQIQIQGARAHLLIFTLQLAHGSLSMQGNITGLEEGARSRIAVVGGTGQYAGARGETFAHQIGEGATDLFIRITL